MYPENNYEIWHCHGRH